MNIVIVKYNAGNVFSVENALKRLGYSAILSDNDDEIRSADKVIFPGVGEADSAMKYLKEKKLDTVLASLSQPFLGICLGLQLLCDASEENSTSCLGIYGEKVKRFPPGLKVPHMGWNQIHFKPHPLFKNIQSGANVYFVHSYFAESGENTIAETEYGLSFSAAMQKNNYYALQFHPEKSAETGERILRNFLEL